MLKRIFLCSMIPFRCIAAEKGLGKRIVLDLHLRHLKNQEQVFFIAELRPAICVLHEKYHIYISCLVILVGSNSNELCLWKRECGDLQRLLFYLDHVNVWLVLVQRVELDLNMKKHLHAVFQNNEV